MLFFQNTQLFLAGYIEKDVGPIMGPIVWVLGFIINLVYNFISLFTEKHSLGFAIIILTLIIRFLMLPQGFSSAKTMSKQRALLPEIEKIKKKYGNSKDREVQQKISAETQALYAKHKVSMLGGCLPLLITMPIFMALHDLIRRLYLYIGKIGDLYAAICSKIIEIPGWKEAIAPIATPHVQPDVLPTYLIGNSSPQAMANFQKLVNKFTTEDWTNIKASITDSKLLNELQELLTRKQNIEFFAGIDLKMTANYWPALLIPILSAATSFLLSYLSSKMTPQNDQSNKMNQMLMMIVMPVMMFFMSMNVSGGVGVYWTVSNIFAVAQQFIINKYYLKRFDSRNAEIIGTAKEKK